MRYTVTMDFYIQAENEKEAIKIAQELAEKQRKELDNQAQILFIHETPFASLQSKLIFSR